MLLPGRPTERLSCVSRVFVERGPLRFGFPLRVFKVSYNSPQSVLEVACINKPGSLQDKTNIGVCRLCRRRAAYLGYCIHQQLFPASASDRSCCTRPKLMGNMHIFLAGRDWVSSAMTKS